VYAKPCLDCGRLTKGASRCEIHQTMIEQRLEAKRAERKIEILNFVEMDLCFYRDFMLYLNIFVYTC
jgi:hypothetical protein